MFVMLLKRQDSDFPEIVFKPRISLQNKANCQKSDHKKWLMVESYANFSVD